MGGHKIGSQVGMLEDHFPAKKKKKVRINFRNWRKFKSSVRSEYGKNSIQLFNCVMKRSRGGSLSGENADLQGR